jgi:hypothetical protein
MTRLAVFGYGSLVSPASAAQSLDRPVELAALVRLAGWRRRWSTFRDNLAVEKTFATPDGSLPPFVLGLNIEREPDSPGANGALIEISEGEAARLDLREMRYDRIDVTEAVRPLQGEAAGLPEFDVVIAYAAKAAHHAPDPPPGAIVIAPYVRTVEAAFGELGPAHLDLYRETTDPPPVEVVEATLVSDQIPAGNPRAW